MKEHGRDQRWRNQVERQSRRWKKAEHERHDWLLQTVHLGTLGLVFVVPVIAGAYLGRWLDQQAEGYSITWTTSLIIIGVAIGAYNVYHQVQE